MTERTIDFYRGFEGRPVPIPTLAESMAIDDALNRRFAVSGECRRIDASSVPPPPPDPPKRKPEPEPLVMRQPAPENRRNGKKRKSGPSGKSKRHTPYKPQPPIPCRHCGKMFKAIGRQLFCDVTPCRLAAAEYSITRKHERVARRRAAKLATGWTPTQRPRRVLIPKDQCPHTEWKSKGVYPNGKARERCVQCQGKHRLKPTDMPSIDAPPFDSPELA